MGASPELLFTIPRGLEQSILLAVLIGLLVTLLLVETFGWVFVGVVVPGYLASVLVIQPQAALAVLLDASLTYAVAKGLERLLGHGGASSEFFGRERFFLLVLVSVFVRQHTQTWIWPLALGSIDSMSPLPLGFSRSFSSIGIVLVPLMANIMWKLDLRRGAWQLTVTTLVTYVALAWWLLPETTLSYSALELTYEDTAIDFLGNAKAYIIFLCTAYIAAQLNLYYGWDFNGILVPALLGLLWFHPLKLAATFGEAVVVYLVTFRLPRAPGLRSINLEGPRRLALVFVTSVLLKWTIGWTLGDDFPTLKITDVYGFGYLLPSLLVIKMMQRKSLRAVLLPTVVTSLLGFVVGSIIGFTLSVFDPPYRGEGLARPTPSRRASARLLSTVEGVGALGHLNALQRVQAEPTLAGRRAYDRAWEALVRWMYEPTRAGLAEVGAEFEPLGMVLEPLGGRQDGAAYALLEGGDGPRHGWDTALLVPGAKGPALVVPRPVAEAPIAEAATEMCRRLDCRALVVAGVDAEDEALGLFGRTPLDIVLEALREVPTLVLHSDPQGLPGPVLHAGPRLPRFELQKYWPDARLDWSEPPPFAARHLPSFGWVLRLPSHVVDDLLREHAPPIHQEPELPSWVMQRERNPLVRTLPATPPPSAEEARYLELELVAPLIELASGQDTAHQLDRLAWRAQRLGLELWRAEDCGDAEPCLGLLDPTGDEGQGWGSLLIRRGEARPIAVEVPRPGRAFGTQRLGLELWHQTSARAIYIGPSNDDETLDPLVLGNIQAPLLPYHQALDRSLSAEHSRPLLLQVMGFGVERMLDTDVVVALGRPMLEERQLPAAVRAMLEPEGALGWADALYSDGSPLLHPLSGLGTPAVEYSLELGSSDIALLWFSPQVRERYVNRSDGAERRRVRAAGGEYAVISELQGLDPDVEPATARPPKQWRDEHERLLRMAMSYRSSHDIHALLQMMAQARSLSDEEISVGVRVGAGALTRLPLVHIEVQGPGWSLRSITLLDGGGERRTTFTTAQPQLRRRLGRALLGRAAVIVVGSAPPAGGPDAP